MLKFEGSSKALEVGSLTRICMFATDLLYIERLLVAVDILVKGRESARCSLTEVKERQ